MCRNIKKLRYEDREPSDQELQDAALQFVRKISGYRKPSKKNEEAFDKAVLKIAGISRKLFKDLEYKTV
ncbi:MAG: DUF2277 domain-containing protein [Calditrichaeota bacterium]|nr:MAG: DUF2277 domain-containing protein [Calditrichota bacterium]MBL1205991.1 DUF2277 domain-containing protein [Calditrichota bacterium]NOG45819.1 DUF2277 domain-containing protein [Calditrichota bacterium]